jgi:uncharacterized RDD family membrane protein YckC
MDDTVTNLEEKNIAAGFWGRLLALGLDYIFLAIPLFAFSYIFYDFVMTLGNIGRVIGLMIGIPYFGILNSGYGNGQTLGKRILKIRVLNMNGQPIPVLRSIFRSSFFLIPLSLNGLDFKVSDMKPILMVPLGIVVFGGIISVSYYFILNIWNRRCLHDYLFDSIVVKEFDHFSMPRQAPKGLHFGLSAILIGIAISFVYFNTRPVSKEFLKNAQTIQESVMSFKEIRYANPSFVNSDFNGQKSTSVNIVVYPLTSKEDIEKILPAIYHKVKTDAPFVAKYDSLGFIIITGYDLIFARFSAKKNVFKAISDWDNYETK